ncbi:unnamed protein product [Owenia fusiformis]|uniref:Metalloendopeptidase n=1 Tax=Owenia fusiformis TaxID=6347 RepID=A0A8S4NYQ4_OWEFU|nr:unnamed protein product [Owenia fusiformis]
MMLLKMLICLLVVGTFGEKPPCTEGPNGEKMRELTLKQPKVECYRTVCIKVKDNGERYDEDEANEEVEEENDSTTDDDDGEDPEIDNSIAGEGEIESNCNDEDESTKRHNKAVKRRRKKNKHKLHETADDKNEEDEESEIQDGDIRVLKNQDDTTKKFKNAIGYNGLWTKGIVYFKIDKSYSKSEKDYIVACLEDLEGRLSSNKDKPNCIKFKKYKAGVRNYLDIKNGGGCSSFVGMLGKNQTVTLKAKGCLYQMGTVQHEIIHALGFYHEHSRPDREEFIKIIWENIKTGFSSNFDVKRSAKTLVPYDYESVMHYKQNAFSKDPRYLRTIQPIQPRKEVGQRNGISDLDTLEIQRLYHCEETVEIDDSLSGRDGSNAVTHAPPEGPAKLKALHCTVDASESKVPCSIREISEPKLLKNESCSSGHYPKFERTTWNWLGGYYWYMDGDMLKDNDTAQLESEVIHPGEYCLQFSYWNYASKSYMRVYIEYNEIGEKYSKPDEQSWITPTIPFIAKNRFVLQFVITIDKTVVNNRFASAAGDFALDEIRLAPIVRGECKYPS